MSTSENLSLCFFFFLQQCNSFLKTGLDFETNATALSNRYFCMTLPKLTLSMLYDFSRFKFIYFFLIHDIHDIQVLIYTSKKKLRER